MSDVVKANFDYIAHVQKDDGSVIELAGTVEEKSHNSVYSWLLERATELGGWLVTQRISSTDPDEPWVDPNPKLIELQPHSKSEAITTVVKEVTKCMFGSTEQFGTYVNTYQGASLCTYKVTEGQSK